MARVFILLSMLLTLLFPFWAQAEEWRDHGLLFHAGFRPFLEGDIQANGIPEDVWRNAIFGSTNFDLPDYRKGLYGAIGLSGTSLYSLYQFLGGNEPWVIAIQVKKSCLTDEAMFESDYSVRFKGVGGRFSQWYVAHRAKYKSLEKLCLERFGEFSDWKEGIRYSVSDHDQEAQNETRKCTPVLNDFLNDQKIKLVFDMVNEDSWYIRDRDCIESITGTPDQLMDLLLTNRFGDPENDILENLYGDGGHSGVFFGGSTLMVAKILAETSRLDAEHARALRDLTGKVEKALGGDKEPTTLHLDSNDENPFILFHLLNSASNAVASKKTGEYQSGLKSLLAKMNQSLGETCQGSHGIKAEFREACFSAAEAQTAKLIALLKTFELTH